MGRVVVLGAGFSKAVAGCPLADELFELIFQEAIDEKDETRDQWARDRRRFLKVVYHLGGQTEPLVGVVTRDGTRIETFKDLPGFHPINIEYLCTILDLNIERPYVPKGIGVDLQGCPIPFMKGITVEDLKSARSIIHHYLVRLLSPDRVKPDRHLFHRALSFVEPGDVIITFNYDVLAEQALWKRKLWNPVDGYGLGQLGQIEEHEYLDASNLPETKVPVIKLHGSVNWLYRDDFLNARKIEICTTSLKTSDPLFEGLEVKAQHPPYESTYPLPSHVVLPTFMKSFEYRWELQLVRQAADAISGAKEIFILGYSLPEADAMANLIFDQIPRDARILIVDPGDPKSLAERLCEKYGLDPDNIIDEKSGVETWVKKDFRYEAYEKEKREEQEIERLFGRLEKPD